jgi:hypothetical protein
MTEAENSNIETRPGGRADAPPGSGRWTRPELALGLAVALLLVLPITYKVGYSGAWDGDPSIHNHLAMDAVNVAVDEHAKGGDALRGLLQCYFTVPKMLHEMLLTAFILALNGWHHVAFGQVERLAAWFSTIWTLGGFVVLFRFLRLFFDRLRSLAILPFACLSGYIVMYANFPRQNMPSHVLCWMALLVYLRCRTGKEPAAPAPVLFTGVLFGAAVAVHYSGTYLFFAFVAVEAVLVARRHRVADALSALALSAAGACAVWFFIDLFYFVYSSKYPHDTDFVGHLIASHGSFLEGMTAASERIDSGMAAFKLEEPKWWFLAGFLYRCLGPLGSFFVACGCASLWGRWRRSSGDEGATERTLIEAVAAVLLTSVLFSFGYFQNARRLMPFYPAWCVVEGYGLFSTVSFITAFLRRLWKGAPSPQVLGAAAVAAIAIVHFATFGPALELIFKCRRDSGYMREYLASHEITRILILPAAYESQMAPVQVNVTGLTLQQADAFDYVVVQRLFAAKYTQALMDSLRRVQPVVAFKNQLFTPIFRYEFPDKKGFIDFGDTLSNQRALYRWRDVRDAFAPLCRHPQ